MTTTTNLNISHIDDEASQAGVIANAGFDKLDKRASQLDIVMTDVNVTLTEAQWIYGILRFTGALGANRHVIVPQRALGWDIVNDTTGGFSLIVRNEAGSPTDTGVTVANARTARVRSTGTQVKRVTADVAH